VRRGPRDATDRAFQKAVQSVAGVGAWSCVESKAWMARPKRLIGQG